jgi:hypothetical protein
VESEWDEARLKISRESTPVTLYGLVGAVGIGSWFLATRGATCSYTCLCSHALRGCLANFDSAGLDTLFLKVMALKIWKIKATCDRIGGVGTLIELLHSNSLA